MDSKNSLIKEMLKHIKGTKERKIAAMLLFNRIKVKPIPPPIPEVKCSYLLSRDQEAILIKSDCFEAMKELIADVTKAVYSELAEYHCSKGRGDLYPRKNIIAVETSSNVTFSKRTPDESRIIEFRAYNPSPHKLQSRIYELIKYALERKNVTSKDSTFTKNYMQIFEELVSNRFIDKTTGDLLYPLHSVEKYLNRRGNDSPRKIKCKYCARDTYVFHPKKEFCYRASCKSSKSRRDKLKK